MLLPHFFRPTKITLVTFVSGTLLYAWIMLMAARMHSNAVDAVFLMLAGVPTMLAYVLLRYVPGFYHCYGELNPLTNGIRVCGPNDGTWPLLSGVLFLVWMYLIACVISTLVSRFRPIRRRS